MDGIEMIDIENPDHSDGAIKAQPGRRQFLIWIDRLVMPPSEDPNPDVLAAAVEPKQCSRYVCLCYAILVELVIATVFITVMRLSIGFHPTTSGGQALHVVGHVVGMIGLFITVLGFVLVVTVTIETLAGNAEGYRMVDLLFM
uniref:Uncharacterized protein n=1 Tax=Aegilops tauschii subsp. strangulata TaxID=200361 RepID=A0A453PWN7_AEGTS